MADFTGKKALVVGGSGGIGKEVCRLLAEQGAQVTVHAGHDSKELASFIRELEQISGGQKMTPLVQRLSPASFENLESSELSKAAACCDILCVAFGPFVQKVLEETTISDWQTVALLDYALPGFLISKALPSMKKNHWGRILLFGGTGTEHRTEFMTNAAYAGAKSGINVLVSSTAATFAADGITCNAILPGPTETEYTQAAASLAEKMPSGKLLKTSEVAQSAIFLLKNASLNGTILRIDQGWSPVARKSAGV